MLRKILITTAAAVVLPLSAPTAWADSSELTVDELMQQVEWLQVQMSTLLKQVDEMKGENTATAKKTEDLEERTEYLEDDVEDIDDRLMGPERHAALDRVLFTGDFRTQAHNIKSDIPDYVNGMGVQGDIVNTFFFFEANGIDPGSIDPSNPPPLDFDQIDQFIADNYSDYLNYLDNLTFDQLKGAVQSLPPELMQFLMPALAQENFVEGYNFDNDVVYTSRLRLRMDAPVAEDVKFAGRLGMYKVWSNSTDAQVFNGQPTSIAWDGTTVGVPNSDIVRVERAYFDWTNIAGLPMYLSIGRRPSTGGAPLNLREDEPRGGTPLGSLINYQFDGATLGYTLNEDRGSVMRLCYGIGYESGYGNGQELQRPADRLDDATFLGLNWDVFKTEDMFLQATVARAFDVTDGFNGKVVLPVDPLTGQDAPPAIIRFNPSEKVGDINLASLVFMRTDGPVDWFLSGNYMSSDPTDNTGVFGGLFTDPYDNPDDQDGSMFYGGARYNFSNKQTKFGLEYNHGSKYWFNFALAEDDFLAPKTSARGDVYEAYLTHRIRDRFVFKVDYMYYDYDYSGSGWLLGAPQKLDDTPVLGFPTYSEAHVFTLSLDARF
ncbi:MAG: DUF3373 family protein [Gammaproteobacteria bacterium]